MSENTSVIFFEQGIPGFEHIHQFMISDLEAELPIKLMQAVDDQEVSLLIVSPFFFYPEYEWELSESAKQELQIQSEQDVEIWSILTIPAEPTEATINLMAPLVMNPNQKTGKQLILHDSNYSSRAPLNRI
ncbi:flagellar assembly protein FliW [Paenibacillus sp. LPE1-1-1.1]|uniref:flagellar assembly protein FliW n=1 Tax=Paenibacillus sp. LPE1-1-1.1 TaxID=3135230 RepID=UPI00342E4DF8